MNTTLLKVIAIVFATWFALTGIFWVYWIALIVAYPFGILSFLIWIKLRKESQAPVIIPIILVLGALLSLTFLVLTAMGVKF